MNWSFPCILENSERILQDKLVKLLLSISSRRSWPFKGESQNIWVWSPKSLFDALILLVLWLSKGGVTGPYVPKIQALPKFLALFNHQIEGIHIYQLKTWCINFLVTSAQYTGVSLLFTALEFCFWGGAKMKTQGGDLLWQRGLILSQGSIICKP